MQLRDLLRIASCATRPCSTQMENNVLRGLTVVKNGTSTGFTFGRATGIESFFRDYKEYRINSTSMEIAIYPYIYKDGAFSAPGDSGSIIADANNRLVSMLTGGAVRPISSMLPMHRRTTSSTSVLRRSSPRPTSTRSRPRSRH